MRGQGPRPTLDDLKPYTFYRGYRLHNTLEGVEVWYGLDKVEVVDSTAIAHEHIDSWQDAR